MNTKRFFTLMIAAIFCILVMPADVSAEQTKGIKLDKSSLSMTVGDSYTFKRTVTGFKKCTIQWSTSDKSVATVSKGVVTAKKAGTATITVKIKGTDYKAYCKITVKNSSADKKSSGTTVKKTSGNVSAKDFVSGMTVGWNLGNSLDAGNTKNLNSETAWGNPKTTKAMITAVKNAGFNTIRIPVSWGNHMDADGKIDAAWLDRVQEVVDYARDNDMYIILNTHHDLNWIKLDENNEAETAKKFKYVWKQIAVRFKDYNEKLIFEGLNEPRTEGSAKEWTGGTSAEWKVLNRLYNDFVETVRAAGGNNKTRFLILTPYGANSSYSTISALEIPDDDRIIISVHGYLPFNSAFSGDLNEKTLTESGKKEIDSVFANIDKVFLSKGIPVIIDEFGSVNKSNTDDRIEIAKYYLSAAEKYGVVCCWWDNGAANVGSENFGLLNRQTLEWFWPELVKAIVDSVK